MHAPLSLSLSQRSLPFALYRLLLPQVASFSNMLNKPNVQNAAGLWRCRPRRAVSAACAVS